MLSKIRLLYATASIYDTSINHLHFLFYLLVASQISEMAAFQKSIYELDRMHHAIKAGYEEDIKRLRHELESRGIPIPPSANPYAALQQQQHSNGAGGPPVRRHSLAPPDGEFDGTRRGPTNQFIENLTNSI